MQDGSYEKDYFPCRFKKDVDLKNQTKIKIQEAWLDFYKPKGEKKTFRYIFVNKFEMASDFDAIKQVQDKQVQTREKTYIEQQTIDDDNLPFY